MNLRILKKLSKRAWPLLTMLGDTRQQIPSKKWEGVIERNGFDRKHWSRNMSVHDVTSDKSAKIFVPRHNGYWIHLREPSEPWKGTLTVGAVTGGLEPEWEEQIAWFALKDTVLEHFTDYGQDIDGPLVPSRRFANPKQVLQAVTEILNQRAPK
jgi:hypothetical protein